MQIIFSEETLDKSGKNVEEDIKWLKARSLLLMTWQRTFHTFQNDNILRNAVFYTKPLWKREANVCQKSEIPKKGRLYI